MLRGRNRSAAPDEGAPFELCARPGAYCGQAPSPFATALRLFGLLVCRQSLFGLQKIFAHIAAFGAPFTGHVVLIPMTPVVMFLGEHFEFRRNNQPPLGVTPGSYLLEARERVSKLPVIVGATQREGVGLLVGSSLQRNDAGVWLCEYPGLSFQRSPVCVTSPAFILMKAADRFANPTTASNQLWQTDFT